MSASWSPSRDRRASREPAIIDAVRRDAGPREVIGDHLNRLVIEDRLVAILRRAVTKKNASTWVGMAVRSRRELLGW